MEWISIATNHMMYLYNPEYISHISYNSTLETLTIHQVDGVVELENITPMTWENVIRKNFILDE